MYLHCIHEAEFESRECPHMSCTSYLGAPLPQNTETVGHLWLAPARCVRVLQLKSVSISKLCNKKMCEHHGWEFDPWQTHVCLYPSSQQSHQPNNDNIGKGRGIKYKCKLWAFSELPFLVWGKPKSQKAFLRLMLYPPPLEATLVTAIQSIAEYNSRFLYSAILSLTRSPEEAYLRTSILSSHLSSGTPGKSYSIF